MSDVKNISGTNLSRTLTFGITSITFACLILMFPPCKLLSKWQVTLSPGAYFYGLWLEPDSQVFMKAYIFNLTNKDAFLTGKEKLRVQEVGPYVYREVTQHLNPVLNEENGTLTIHPRYSLEWDPELNFGSEEDIFILPNVVALLFANELSQQNFLIKLAANTMMTHTNTSSIVKQTAKEFMFGAESTLVSFSKSLMPQRIHFERLGLVDRMYDMTDDVATVYTGTKNENLAGVFSTYNKLSYLPQWKSPCDKIDGASDAVKFPSQLRTNQTLYFYRKSLCRSIAMVQAGGRSTVDGIAAISYTFADDALDNGETNEENKCFCRNEKCLAPGLIDITDCSAGFSMALSYPHFYRGDISLVKAVDGLHPQKKLHETFFTINPDTGALIKTSVRIQINAVLGDMKGISDCEPFSEMVVPLMWVDITTDGLSTKSGWILYIFLNVLPLVDELSPYVLLIIGFVVIYRGIRTPAKKMEEYDDEMDEMPPLILERPYISFWERKRLSTDQNRELNTYYHSLLHNTDEENL